MERDYLEEVRHRKSEHAWISQESSGTSPLLVLQVASPRMLYRMKMDTVRLQDRADAARIREAFDLEDE